MSFSAPQDVLFVPEQEIRLLVVVPVLDEVQHLPDLLPFLVREIDGVESAAIVVVDGGSTDGSLELVAEKARADRKLRLLINDERIQAAAVNLAVSRACLAEGALIIRVDAHSNYRQGFVRGLLRTHSRNECSAIVVPLIAGSHGGFWRRSAGALQRSWLGTGGARHRTHGESGFVDHGHHALIAADPFVSIGGYATDLAANEDYEFDARLARAGHRIFLDAEWPVDYVPRGDPASIFRQYFRNGFFRAKTARTLREPPALRQLLPVLISLLLLGSCLAAFIFPVILLVPVGYLLACFGLSAGAARADGLGLKGGLATTLLAALMHTGFGFGYLIGLMRRVRGVVR